MSECRDCMHDKVCSEYFHAFWGHTANKHSDLINAEPKDCPYFKDRSRFVELPCKVGDTVYRLKDGKVTKEQVVEFEISSRGVVLYRTLGYELGYSDYFGNSLFLTKEEAEQALKERET